MYKIYLMKADKGVWIKNKGNLCYTALFDIFRVLYYRYWIVLIL
jgi:hypothetical protein